MLDGGNVIQDGPAAQVVGSYMRTGLGTTAAREWPDVTRAPGNDVVRLRAVRVRTAKGEVGEAIDIREPVAIEMEFDVKSGGRVLIPNFHAFNDDGTCLFVAQELTSTWKRKPRPVGSYRAVLHIPGNFLSEGTVVIAAAISTVVPLTVHVHETDLVSFQVFDKAEGDSARGDYVGPMGGVVRPLFDWTTTAISSDEHSAG